VEFVVVEEEYVDVHSGIPVAIFVGTLDLLLVKQTEFGEVYFLFVVKSPLFFSFAVDPPFGVQLLEYLLRLYAVNYFFFFSLFIAHHY